MINREVACNVKLHYHINETLYLRLISVFVSMWGDPDNSSYFCFWILIKKERCVKNLIEIKNLFHRISSEFEKKTIVTLRNLYLSSNLDYFILAHDDHAT